MKTKKVRSLAGAVVRVVALVYSISMILVFTNSFMMTRTALMEDIDEVLFERLHYYNSVVTRWLDVRLEHVNILKDRLENIPEAEYTDEKALQMVMESTEYGMSSGVIADYIIYPDNSMVCGDGWVPEAGYQPTLNDYYKKATETGKLFITTPYVDATTGEFVITISVPLVREGRTFGVLARDLNIGEVRAITEEYTGKEGAYLYILDNEKNILSHPNAAFAPSGQNVYNITQFPEGAFVGTLGETEEVYRGNDYDGLAKCFAEYKNEKTGWVIGISYPQQVNTDRLARILYLCVSIGVGALVISLTMLLIFVRRRLRPVRALAEAAQKLEQGQLDITYDIKSKDEIGLLAEAFKSTTEYLRSIIGEISYIMTQMAEGNLDVEAKQEYHGEFEEIHNSIEAVSRNLNEIIGGIRLAAEQVAEGSEQLAEGAQQLAASSQEQNNQISYLVNSCNHISQIVNDNAGKCKTAGEITTEVSEQLEESNRQMQQMMEAMARISTSSKQISVVNKTIEDIAFQTNILALNAAVEAARVGEAGKGFAVVADEVRALAAKSGEAAQNTTQLVDGSIQAVENGAQISDSTAVSLAQSVAIAQMVYGLIQDIVQLSEEQTEEVRRITDGIKEISNLIQSNSATAQESAASSEELSGQAQIMKELVERFKVK